MALLTRIGIYPQCQHSAVLKTFSDHSASWSIKDLVGMPIKQSHVITLTNVAILKIRMTGSFLILHFIKLHTSWLPWVSSFQRKISMGQSGIEHGSHEHLSEAHEIDHNWNIIPRKFNQQFSFLNFFFTP